MGYTVGLGIDRLPGSRSRETSGARTLTSSATLLATAIRRLTEQYVEFEKPRFFRRYLPRPVAMENGVFTIPLPTHGRRPAATTSRRPSAAAALPDFVAGPENALARSSTSAIDDQHCRFSPLHINGPPGVGKSHLALGLAALWKQQYPSRPLLVTDGPSFVRELSIAYKSKGLADFRRRLLRAGLVLIDTFDQLADKDAAQIELLRLFDAADRQPRQLLVVAEQLPSAKSGLLPGVASRLLAGLALPLRVPGSDARAVLVARLATQRGATLSAHQAKTIAGAFPLAPGPLSKVVNNLLDAAQLAGKPVDDRLIADLRRRRRTAAAPSLAEVTSAVARQFGVRTADLRGPSRRQTLTRARATAMHLARELTPESMAAIGSHFGGRDHTTVLHACRATRRRLDTDPAVRQAVATLTRQLTAGNSAR
jgi:chromosomal replication initiator protein